MEPSSTPGQSIMGRVRVTVFSAGFVGLFLFVIAQILIVAMNPQVFDLEVRPTGFKLHFEGRRALGHEIQNDSPRSIDLL